MALFTMFEVSELALELFITVPYRVSCKVGHSLPGMGLALSPNVSWPVPHEEWDPVPNTHQQSA